MTQAIDQYIREHCGLDQHRPYLGMSSINNCPRLQYHRYFNGIQPNDLTYRKCYQSYFYEREVKKILTATGHYKPGSERTLSMLFEGIHTPFEGHTDGEDCSGNLIEIKSLHPRGFEEVVSTGKLKHPAYWQVQAYMLYGDYQRCTVWLANTEVFELYPLTVHPSPVIMSKVEERATQVLAAIDTKTPPPCICGRCNP